MENKNLGELVRMCGEEFHMLQTLVLGPKWQAVAWVREGEKEPREGLGETPEEAVENLYKALQNE